MLCIAAVTPAAIIIRGVIAVVTAAATSAVLVMVVAGVVGFVEAVVVVVVVLVVVGVGGVVCSSSCHSIFVGCTEQMTAKWTMSACYAWTPMQLCL